MKTFLSYSAIIALLGACFFLGYNRGFDKGWDSGFIRGLENPEYIQWVK